MYKLITFFSCSLGLHLATIVKSAKKRMHSFKCIMVLAEKISLFQKFENATKSRYMYLNT